MLLKQIRSHIGVLLDIASHYLNRGLRSLEQNRSQTFKITTDIWGVLGYFKSYSVALINNK